MPKIHGAQPKLNAAVKKSVPKPACEQFPAFSFRYLTSNSTYSLACLNKGRDRETVLEGIHQKLCELSSASWLHWSQQRKNVGLEMVAYQGLRLKTKEGVFLEKDTPIYVFRFNTHLGNKKGRILGYRDGSCAVMYIIGYDIDFSAYEHGG